MPLIADDADTPVISMGKLPLILAAEYTPTFAAGHKSSKR